MAGRWRMASRVDHPDPHEANRLALADLEGGSDALALVSAAASGASGFGIENAACLETVLAGIDLGCIETRLDTGADAFTMAESLVGLAKRRGHDPATLRLDLGIDPIGTLAATGVLSGGWVQTGRRLADLVRRLSSLGFRGPVLRADGRLWHAAGASGAQELAAVVGSGLLYLRALEAGGLGLDLARRRLSFELAADADLVQTVSKFRALRRLWARIETICGLVPVPIRLQGETAWRMMSAVSPHTNIIRAAVACFGAATGGADSVSVLPFTLPLGLPDAAARRLARNTQHILAEESHLWRVTDPAGGADVVEAATGTLCEDAWSSLQAIEREGGLVASLEAGLVQRRVGATRQEREGRIAGGTEPIVGVTIFRDAVETPVAVLRPAITQEMLAALGGPAAEPLPRRRLSEAFETRGSLL